MQRYTVHLVKFWILDMVLQKVTMQLEIANYIYCKIKIAKWSKSEVKLYVI